jgi:cytochrome o ubiquinol oxidase operon protein cyoD
MNVDSAERGYIVGFVASLILTVIPFVLAGLEILPKGSTVAVLVVCAIVQVLVHFSYFLHMETKTEEGRWNFISLVFSAIVVLILIVGSIWIMYNLNINMAM